ncbi:hypothetical protein [Pseudomarimonas arenosa]|uniref:Glycosyltransferase 2-like domain-containing protein n=1 Tax=Pseudomarimonas arenosa TaxID=2774145 RepID=A0AAW3ZMM0_9GAMM|nr:hypothetical protein [Pseudomarimonas arenosa]MBD8526437.1 hypothetical protein [Pseudomarimonas arenosa]
MSSTPAQTVPLYAVVDGRSAALGPDEVVFYDPVLDRSHVMATPVVQALDLCREFQPLDVHVQRICERLPNMAGQQAAVKRVLENLVARGCLVTDDAFVRTLSDVPGVGRLSTAGIFIRACDRPEQLERLLASLIEHQARFSAPGTLVVVDDSKRPESVERHAALLATFARQWNDSTHHVTPSLWRNWAEAWSEQTGQGVALRRMLLGDASYRGPRGGGEGRNLITLLAAGGKYLLFDDDHLLPMRRHPGAQDLLAPPAMGWAPITFASMDEALAQGDECSSDPLALHLDLCGRRLGECLGEGRPVGFSAHNIRGLAPSREPLLRGESRILLTQHGHRGGSCSAGISWLFMLPEGARQGYAADSARYQALRGDVPVWFGTSHYVLDRSGRFPPLAIDNSRLMPCTSPYGRGEDALFNSLALASDAKAVQLHLPMSVGHKPEAGRDRSALFAAPHRPEVSSCLSDLVDELAPSLYGEHASKRFSVLSASMRDLIDASDSGLLSYLRTYFTHRRSLLVENLKRTASQATNACSEWQQDLRSQLEVNARAIVERGAPRFQGMAENATGQDCVERFRREVESLADGLDAWPAAWEVAIERQAKCLEQSRVTA